MNLIAHQFQAMVDNSPEAIVAGLDGRYVYVNSAAVRLFGARGAEELLGTPILDRIHPGFRDRVSTRLHRLQHGEHSPPLEEVYLRLDGSPVDVEVFAVPIQIGNRQGGVAFVRDISERKRAEALVRSQAERHATLLQTSGDGFWIADNIGRIIEVNGAFCRMSGYTAEELLQLRIPDLEAKESPDEVATHIEKIIATGFDRFETRHRRRNGEAYDVEVNASYWASERKFLVFQRDLSERKRAESELARNREQLRSVELGRALTHAMGVGVIGIDASRRAVFSNPWAQRLLGLTEAQMLGAPLEQLIRATTQEGDALTQENCPAWPIVRLGGTYNSSNWRFTRADGSSFPVRVILAPFVDATVPGGAVLTFHDISDRISAEQALVDAGRRKDEFLAMLAHELRNPLAPIRNAAFILGQLDLKEPTLAWAQGTIETQVQHLSRLVDELLDISRIVQRKIALKRERIDLRVLVERAASAARPTFDERAQRFTVRVAADPIWVHVDPVRLTQVIANLLDNASNYTPRHGTIELDAGAAGGEAVLLVQDDGSGIAPELLPRVFDLFQQGERSLDRGQGGLGIGLTLVQQLVLLHGGRVEAASEGQGKGARFTAWVPLAEPLAAPRPQSVTTTPAPHRARILVVDDEPAVAVSTAMLVQVMGYEAKIAANGPAAIELVGAFRPRVVLLDIGLKGMDGYETARRLRQAPGGGALFIVALTGYADEGTRLRALEAGCNHHVAKPVNPDVLLRLIADRVGDGTSDAPASVEAPAQRA